eukprot:2125776-Pyramimonas_sp.AAC.1
MAEVTGSAGTPRARHRERQGTAHRYGVKESDRVRQPTLTNLEDPAQGTHLHPYTTWVYMV